MDEWHYAKDGQQLGPVSAEAIRGMLASGELDREKGLVWKTGMAEWAAPATVPELSGGSRGSGGGFAAPAAVDGDGNAGGGGESSSRTWDNPYATPESGLSEQTVSQAELPKVKPAKYGLMVGFMGTGFVMLIAGYIYWFGVELAGSEGAPPSGDIMSVGAAVGIFGGLVLMLIGGILSLVYLYRAWVLLQPRTSYSTPGKAVGFLFIPFFNLYWYFVAYWRWAQEWNRLVASDAAHPAAPRMTEGLFLAYAILQLAGLVAGALAAIPAIVVFFIIMQGMCKAINYAAEGQA
ncbi:MAG: DUF4339 domain-containing protein [Verrucomicrobiota bacterium]